MSNLPLSLMGRAMFPRKIGNVDINDAPTLGVVPSAVKCAWRAVLRFPNGAEKRTSDPTDRISIREFPCIFELQIQDSQRISAC